VREIGSVVTWRLGCAGLGLGWYCVGVGYTVPATKATPSTYPGTHAWPCTSTNKSPAINRRYLLRSSGNTTITIRHNHNRDWSCPPLGSWPCVFAATMRCLQWETWHS